MLWDCAISRAWNINIYVSYISVMFVSCIPEKRHEENFIANFRLFWMLYSVLWVIPRRLNFMCRRFGTLCSIFIGCVSRAVSSPSHTYYRPPLGVFALHSLFLYSDTRPPRSRLLPIGAGYFEPNIYLYKYPSNVVPSDPRYTAQLVASHRSGQIENCSEDGYAGSPPEQKWSLRQERSPAV